MKATLLLTLAAAALAGLAISHGCAGTTLQQAQACSSDQGCDPGDFCVQGVCQGTSAAGGGGDAGGDGGGGGAGDGGGDGGGGGASDGGGDGGGGGPGDGGGGGPGDGGSDGGGLADGGGVTTEGGAVDLLDFLITGDTRPPFCELAGQYPREIIQKEVAAMARLPAQLALDTGDHMNACAQIASSANTQMGYYVDAVKAYPNPFFMTMGNHECDLLTDCNSTLGAIDVNLKAFRAALAQVSHKTDVNYSVDIATRLGLARLVFVADNFAGSGPSAWLEATLAEADAKAAYTFVIKHHPMTGSRQGPAWSHDIVARHQITLFIAGHDHKYAHDTTAFGGRSVICGLGGASASDTGFCRAQQVADGRVAFTRYDIDGNALDTWSVTAR